MNELQRQQYLSALGVEGYMPRWHLPFAPLSLQCEQSFLVDLQSSNEFQHIKYPSSDGLGSHTSLIKTEFDSKNTAPINNIIDDIFNSEKSSQLNTRQINNVETILAELSVPVAITPFSLSVWRPIDDLMIIDSRNTKLALPTETLLGNILQSFFKEHVISLNYDVLRWPMIENSFAKQTANDVRAELQTWLSVQCEIRPIKYLWLMGENAATYLLPDDQDYQTSLWQSLQVLDISLNAIILPSLNQLLKNSLMKRQLLLALKQYHL